MLDFFRDRLSAAEILDFLEHLPRTSAYHSAVATDEELAAQVAESGEAPPRRVSPPLSEYSPEVQVLAEVRDVLVQTLHVLLKVNGGKPGRFKPYPRPETALDKALTAARRRVQYQHHKALRDRLLAGR